MPEINGNNLNLETWLDDHGDAVYLFAYNLIGDRGIADDLVQEILLEAIPGREKFQIKSNVRT